jgi:putative acetyltransferase
MHKIVIRPAKKTDAMAVRRINREAFKGDFEADLVDKLRQSRLPLISLVSVDQNVITGHMLFSEVQLAGYPELALMALGPVAVLPVYQNRGYGSRLIKHGLKMVKQKGIQAVVVLGHPDYYPRFGFKPARLWGIMCEWEVPDEAFMLNELVPGSLTGKTGMIQYHPAFHSTS